MKFGRNEINYVSNELNFLSFGFNEWFSKLGLYFLSLVNGKKVISLFILLFTNINGKPKIKSFLGKNA